jgi:lipoprotein-anchoring transpeptidase ErfK/SrfK
MIGGRRAKAPAARAAIALASVGLASGFGFGGSALARPLAHAASVRLGSRLATGASTARIVTWTAVRRRPGSGRVFTHVGPLTSWSHESQRLLVIGTKVVGGREWERVLLGIRPDGSNGWIRRDNVVLGATPYWIDLDKAKRTLTVMRNGRRVLRVSTVIGKAATPTPDGIAAIYERNRQPSPNDFLGTWALPLTVFSNVLLNFGGGPGRVAIHGRGGASLLDPLGSARSHGCIRIDNGAVGWLARHIAPGTPVDITG